jgi:signal transduction histidine kinase
MPRRLMPDLNRESIGLVALVAFVELATGIEYHHASTTFGGIVGLLVLVLVGPIALLWRRRYPMLVLGVILAQTIVAALTVFDAYIPFFAPVVALFGYSSRVSARRACRALILFSALPITLLTLSRAGEEGGPLPSSETIGFLVFAAASYVLAWFFGRRFGLHERELAELERRRREAVAIERTRLARELHDVVAHAVSVIVLEAAGAKAVFDKRPDEVRRALDDIVSGGQKAMTELRVLLDVLRDGSDDESSDMEHHSIDEIGELLHDTEATGAHISFEVVGEPTTVPSSIGHTAYRVVQEALTNALKHGGPDAETTVRLAWNTALLVEVTDRVPPDAPVAPRTTRAAGYGLLGLHERVSMLGGEFWAGPQGDGAFRVTARLPVGTREARGEGHVLPAMGESVGSVSV